jgi:hypothetical protein
LRVHLPHIMLIHFAKPMGYALVELRDASYSYVVGLQRELDSALDVVLSNAPRRSILLMDTGPKSEDGGFAFFSSTTL